MSTLWPNWFDKLTPGQKKFALMKEGMDFVFRFLFKKGGHLFIIGTTGSGKTQKAYWIADWVKTTKEIVIWIDSAKNGEMLPLLTMGKPVNIICPKGCDVRITEWSKTEHKYIPIQNHPSVVTVPDPGSAWWAVKKDNINIFCFRVSFGSDEAARNWMGGLFTTLSEWMRKSRMPHILPFALFGDESHWFLAGEKITSDSKRKALTELIAELSLENRAKGARLVLMAQSYKSLPPASRENMINNLICRGCKVSPDENNTLSPYNTYSSGYPSECGVFVFEAGFVSFKNKESGLGYKWPFPYYEKPKYKIEYIGQFDEPTKERAAEEEVEQEMTSDLSKYQALQHDLIDYTIPHVFNRFEVINYDDE